MEMNQKAGRAFQQLREEALVGSAVRAGLNTRFIGSRKPAKSPGVRDCPHEVARSLRVWQRGV
jgi:hypothetical protein